MRRGEVGKLGEMEDVLVRQLHVNTVQYECVFAPELLS